MNNKTSIPAIPSGNCENKSTNLNDDTSPFFGAPYYSLFDFFRTLPFLTADFSGTCLVEGLGRRRKGVLEKQRHVSRGNSRKNSRGRFSPCCFQSITLLSFSCLRAQYCRVEYSSMLIGVPDNPTRVTSIIYLVG